MKTTALLLSALFLCALALTGGCTTATTATINGPTTAATPVRSADPAVREELHQLDAFLEANANRALENALRQNLDHIGDAAFLREYPAWQKFAANRPAVRPALQAEPRFFLHRALARMTGQIPLELANLGRLDGFLDAHPAIQRALEENPLLLTDQDFLLQHPSLAAFFDQHPDLYSAFYQNSGSSAAL